MVPIGCYHTAPLVVLNTSDSSSAENSLPHSILDMIEIEPAARQEFGIVQMTSFGASQPTWSCEAGRYHSKSCDASRCGESVS